MTIKVVEKKDNLAVHGIFYSRESAQNHIDNVLPGYCERKIFMDKTLTPDDFTILEEN